MSNENERSVGSDGSAMRGDICRCPDFDDDDKAWVVAAVLRGPLAIVAIVSVFALARTYFMGRTVDATATLQVMSAEEIQSLRNRVREIEERLEK